MKLAGQRSYGFGGDPGGDRNPVGRVLRYQRGKPVEVLATARQPTENESSLGKLVQDGEQEQSIGAGPDEEMLVGQGRRLGPSRVDHDQLATALSQLLVATFDPGSGHDAAIGRQRVGSDDDHELGALQIRDGKEQLVAEHEVRSHHRRQLVARSCRESISRSQGAKQGGAENHSPEVVDIRVSQIDPDGVAPVPFLDLVQAVGDLVQRPIPIYFFPIAADPSKGGADPIGVVVEIRERGRLRTDVTAAEDIPLISAHRDHSTPSRGDLDPAHGFA